MADYLIATENDAASIGHGSPYTDKLGCTKARAVALGCSLYSPSSGYSNNQLVRKADLYYTPPTPPVNYDITVSWSGITISTNYRMYGAPQYMYNGTMYSLVQSGDWPIPGTSNKVNIPTGLTSLDTTTAMWSSPGSGFVIQGPSVTNSNTPSYISFKMSNSAGIIVFKKTLFSSGARYEYYTTHQFGYFTITGGGTLYIYNYDKTY